MLNFLFKSVGCGTIKAPRAVYNVTISTPGSAVITSTVGVFLHDVFFPLRAICGCADQND